MEVCLDWLIVELINFYVEGRLIFLPLVMPLSSRCDGSNGAALSASLICAAVRTYLGNFRDWKDSPITSI